jgi:TetR/AcrR family transcriptional regulator
MLAGMSSANDLRIIALAEFARAGYVGTSLQRIADLAGLSKSSVLYHFSSKETLLEAAIAPAIDRMAEILSRLEGQRLTAQRRRAFIEEFVDFLLEYRLEVHMFINQGPSIVDVPVINRANELVQKLATFFSSVAVSTEEAMRFGIALGGAAYFLVSRETFGLPTDSDGESRTALITIMTELLVPVSSSTASE